MSDPAERLARAELDAAAARDRLSHTTTVLQQRLEPRRLVREARTHLTGVRDTAVERAGTAVRQRPGALAGAVALAGLWLGRHRIATVLRRKRRKATGDRDAS